MRAIPQVRTEGGGSDSPLVYSLKAAIVIATSATMGKWKKFRLISQNPSRIIWNFSMFSFVEGEGGLTPSPRVAL